MPNVSKDTDQQKKKIRTSKKISLLPLLLLIYLVESNLPIRTRLIKRTKTTKDVFGTIKNKNRVVAITSSQQVLIPFWRKKKKISFISNTFFAERKVITLANVSRKMSQKTSVGLENLHANDCS